MLGRPAGPLGRLRRRRLLRHWTALADAASRLAPRDLRRLRAEAAALRRAADRVLTAADRIDDPAAREAPIPAPHGSDWTHRPALWRRPADPGFWVPGTDRCALDGETALFHDCRRPELSARQSRNPGAGDLAPFGLTVDVLHFEGSFLSLAIDLPAGAAHSLRRRHVLVLSVEMESERPLPVFARLNIRHGPDTEQIVQRVDGAAVGAAGTAFDLALLDLNEKRVEKLWIDLIFEEPRMNRILLRDLTLSRHPGAAL